jgi:molybdenum cofactor cytidylyltransferase
MCPVVTPPPDPPPGRPAPREGRTEAIALVLAAGASRRMGEPKLLLPWRGHTVLDATLAALLDGGATRAVVVVARGGPLLGWKPPPHVSVAENAHPDRGMMSSVLAGLDNLPGPADPLLVTPADLPALLPATVATLLAAYRRLGGVVVPRCGPRRGHPLLLAPEWQARVPGLAAGGGTLRQMLELAAGCLVEVTVDDPGAVRDVDTPGDYAKLRSS